MSGKPGETVTIDIAVVDKDGNPITEGNVTVELPDGTNVTVSVVNGVANADWNIPNGFTINNYTVNVTYNGNEYFESSTNKSKAEVRIICEPVRAMSVKLCVWNFCKNSFNQIIS